MLQVHSCLAAAKEVRLWLETDCDVWSGLAAALQGIPCLKEVVVRTRPPHTFNVRPKAVVCAEVRWRAHAVYRGLHVKMPWNVQHHYAAWLTDTISDSMLCCIRIRLGHLVLLPHQRMSISATLNGHVLADMAACAHVPLAGG